MSTILLGGASGFIGSELARVLESGGHRIVRLARTSSAARAPCVRWDPAAGAIDRAGLAEARPDVVINLAGEPIARRWTARRRARIRDSRVNGTKALSEALAALPNRPDTFISGSAIGYYGADPKDVLTEESAAGTDFLSQVAREWEEATRPASRSGVRVVLARTGIVLGRDGGALARMLLPFRLGLGGPLGAGRQWMSWISHSDVVRAFQFLMGETALRGPVNLVAPEPTQNREFARTLGRVLKRPSLLPVPRFVLKLLFGPMARETILADQKVIPKRLAGAGFEFLHPRLEDALRAELRR